MIVCSAVIQKMTLSQLQVNNSFCRFILWLLSPFGEWGDMGEASLELTSLTLFRETRSLVTLQPLIFCWVTQLLYSTVADNLVHRPHGMPAIEARLSNKMLTCAKHTVTCCIAMCPFYKDCRSEWPQQHCGNNLMVAVWPDTFPLSVKGLASKTRTEG